MKEIIITSQAELDELPDRFDDYTVIKINSPDRLLLSVRKARENSSVEAWGNSSVVARGNSSVVAWGNSSVVAWGNSSVVARGNSISRILSDDVKIKSGQQAVVVCQNCRPQIVGDVNIIRTTQFIHNLNSFTEIYPEIDGRITLYKSVRPDTRCDFRTNNIKYEGRVICPDFDPDISRQCGGGLHLSPKPQLARNYNNGTILECRVPLKYTDDDGVERDNIVVYGRDITKVRCREVDVVGVWKGK